MDELPKAFGRKLVPIVGLLAAALAGATSFVVAGSAIAQRGAESTSLLLDATHMPRLLTAPGEQIDLDYDAVCIDPEVEDAEASCAVEGWVFLRAGTKGEFLKLALEKVGPSGSRLSARVPEAIARSRTGFSYYAEIEAASGTAVMTLPAGGAVAPHRSLPLERTVEIDLGKHRFDEPTRPDERVASAAWGTGPNDAGLEQGRNLAPTGASAFDVDPSGTVIVLDQAHRRLLRWRKGSALPTRVPVAIAGTLADMSLAPDGTIYVLESLSRAGATPLVRRFDSYGRRLGSTEIAERTSAQIRQGPAGALVLQQPSSQWMPIAAGGAPIEPEGQRQRGRSGRPLRDGGEVIVLRRGNEIRVALTAPIGTRRSWRVTSDTALAEVQLAEPIGRRLVLVVRVFTDDEDEFEALVLDDEGIVARFSVDDADWAEAAPLGRFRLVGNSLFQLGSTPAGAFVDRYDLEVR